MKCNWHTTDKSSKIASIRNRAAHTNVIAAKPVTSDHSDHMGRDDIYRQRRKNAWFIPAALIGKPVVQWCPHDKGISF